MEKTTLRTKYGPYFAQLLKVSHAAAKIDETNVYQPGNPQTLEIMQRVVTDNIKSGSRLEGRENLIKFCDMVKEGKSGLILAEHFSNCDLPNFLYLLKNDEDPRLQELSSKIVAIAGMKLNEEDPFIRAFSECFTRVVIYPTRSQNAVEASNMTEEEKIAEETRAKKINFAAMRAMDNCKRRGEVILVFPSGTRYRPGHPETKRGLREIDSYLRLFDIVTLISINGNIVRIDPENEKDMLGDLVVQDQIICSASEIIECKPFRKQFMANLPQDEADPKQKIIDYLMGIMEKQHDEIEKIRDK